jgi:hypothetical protein
MATDAEDGPVFHASEGARIVSRGLPRMVSVCLECLRSACLAGRSPCPRSGRGAVHVNENTLIGLALESPLEWEGG